MSNNSGYQCSGYTNGHICENGLRVRRDVVESKLLAGIRDELLSEKALAEFQKRIRRQLVKRPADPRARRRQELTAEVDNLVSAIGQGLMSPSVGQKLQAAEAELAALPLPSTVIRADDVLKKLPDAIQRFKRMVDNLGEAPIDTESARIELKQLLGPIWIAPKGDHLVAKVGLESHQLRAVCGSGSGGLLPGLKTDGYIEVALR